MPRYQLWRKVAIKAQMPNALLPTGEETGLEHWRGDDLESILLYSILPPKATNSRRYRAKNLKIHGIKSSTVEVSFIYSARRYSAGGNTALSLHNNKPSPSTTQQGRTAQTTTQHKYGRHDNDDPSSRHNRTVPTAWVRRSEGPLLLHTLGLSTLATMGAGSGSTRCPASSSCRR